jgi:iron(III) transport system substrate-binding protein
MAWSVLNMKPLIGICVSTFFLLLSSGGSSAQERWRADWEKTVDAAKKEGELIAYIGEFEGVLEEFRKIYREIRVVSVAGRTGDMAKKILAERRAGKYLADVFNGGPNTQFNVLYKGEALSPVKSVLTLPGVLDESKWLERKHKYIDEEERHVFAYVEKPGGFLAYNTSLVKPESIKSHWDLLHPTWKGRILSMEPTHTSMGSVMGFFYHHSGLGPEFIKRLFGGTGVTFGRDPHQMTNWLAAGKFSLCFGCRPEEIGRAKRQGLPVDFLIIERWKEGGYTTPSSGTLSLMKQAPHPNAAKVFINWYLSREGQIAMQKFAKPESPVPSRRIDIPKGEIPEENKLIEGASYLDTARPEFADLGPVWSLGKEIMKGRR